MKEEEDISDKEIATTAARDRIIGVAIRHYLEGDRAHLKINPECEMCAAVKAFEERLKPGELKLMGDLYAWNGRNDG